jgi:hypothetical protein
MRAALSILASGPRLALLSTFAWRAIPQQRQPRHHLITQGRLQLHDLGTQRIDDGI